MKVVALSGYSSHVQRKGGGVCWVREKTWGEGTRCCEFWFPLTTCKVPKKSQLLEKEYSATSKSKHSR